MKLRAAIVFFLLVATDSLISLKLAHVEPVSKATLAQNNNAIKS